MPKMQAGSIYEIRFMDPRQEPYTWFAGKGVFVRETAEDFGTGEQHYIFAVGEDEQCYFPASSVMQEIV